ncbi:hypothetical protein FSP39_001397 [Pinctada imbricata]|uniref:Uncharacterized protein n=1 Tax=Pinctada imbricata TaxID=66713 RepID=A0AA88YGW6_PINIB|nr:hypothetical protein FSP39_001397 [Pinctada imbricata]
MCGGQLNEGLSLVQQAKENGERLMPCRETGIVLLVEFNLLCQKYEKSHLPLLKENLLKVISESIDHFEDEQEYVRDDFRLIIRLRASFIYLGIGLFCDILSIPVSDDERKHGESCLNEVEKNWNQLQIRWKMIWYFAKARVKQMDGFYEFAATLLAKALDIAGENNFTRELQNIVKFREHCNEKLIEHSNKQDNIRQNIVESCLNEFFDE